MLRDGGRRADEWAASSASGVLLLGACEPGLRAEALGRACRARAGGP